MKRIRIENDKAFNSKFVSLPKFIYSVKFLYDQVLMQLNTNVIQRPNYIL